MSTQIENEIPILQLDLPPTDTSKDKYIKYTYLCKQHRILADGTPTSYMVRASRKYKCATRDENGKTKAGRPRKTKEQKINELKKK